MSLGKEIVSEVSADYYAWLDSIQIQARSKIWITKSGRRIPVNRMSSKHIINTVRLLEKMNGRDEFTPWITVFRNELSLRGIGL